MRKVLLDLDPKVGSTQADKVAGGWAKHGYVGLPVHRSNVNMSGIARRLRYMQEATSLKTLLQTFRDREVLDIARGQVVAALDDLVAIDLDKRDRFGVAGLKSYRCPGGNVKAETVGSDTVEL